MLNYEVKKIYLRWIKKADEFKENSLSRYFDEFFTLFVAYNMLYSNATKLLVAQGQAKLNRFGGVPDADGATKNVVKYLNADILTPALLNEDEVKSSIDSLIRELETRFYVRGENWDRKKIEDLRSGANNRVGKAALELVYGIRCNMFHGGKNYEEIQRAVLIPCIVILRKVNNLLFSKLSADCNQT